jgi:hypothetical protein
MARRVVVATLVVLSLLTAAPLARAQVPALPPVPPVPPEVGSAVEQAQSTLVPIIVDGLIQAYPAINAVGFALRPACGATWASILVISTAASAGIDTRSMLPVIYASCGPAYGEGPADAVFGQLDEAAGAQLQSTVDPVLEQAEGALAPARPNAGQVCSTAGLIGSPTAQAPPPAHRMDLLSVLCGD